MVPNSTLLTHLDYTLWASSKLLDAATRLTPDQLSLDLKVSHTSVLSTLQHIYYADRTWLARLTGQQIPFADPEPGPSRVALKEAWPLVIAGVLKAVYDLILLRMFRDLRPPEEQVADRRPSA